MRALNTATSTRNTSGDGTAIIVAPGATSRVIIRSIQVQSEEDTAVTALLKSGSTTIDRVYCGSKGTGKLEILENPIYCGFNDPIYLNLSGAVQVGYVIRYHVETK